MKSAVQVGLLAAFTVALGAALSIPFFWDAPSGPQVAVKQGNAPKPTAEGRKPLSVTGVEVVELAEGQDAILPPWYSAEWPRNYPLVRPTPERSQRILRRQQLACSSKVKEIAWSCTEWSRQLVADRKAMAIWARAEDILNLCDLGKIQDMESCVFAAEMVAFDAQQPLEDGL